MGNFEYIKLIKKDIDKMSVGEVIDYIYYCSKSSPREYLITHSTDSGIRDIAKNERHLRCEKDALILKLHRLDKLSQII
jgi:hypothetical protein